MLINKIVIGVSGGPDSMYLLNDLYNNRKYEPIVVHINYGLREESKEEEEFVTKYCKEREIKLYVFKVNEENILKYKSLGNKQSIYREFRYDKYFEVAKENNAKDIFIAQHKDDFIETAIMQKQRSDDYLFYGIERLSSNKGFRVHRPLLEMYKDDILEFMNSNNLEYKIDKSNFEPIYERNKVRLELSNLTRDEKDKIYEDFQKVNVEKEELRNTVDKYYKVLLESDLEYNTYTEIPDEIKNYVLYKLLINNNEQRINISSDKLNGLKEFLANKRGDKSFRLMENLFMAIKNGKIIIYKTN